MNMKVFIIIEIYYNGEYDAERVHKISANETKVDTYCKEMNAKRKSCYDSSYYYINGEVEDSND